MIKKILFLLLVCPKIIFSQTLNLSQTKNYIDNLFVNSSIYLEKDGTLSFQYKDNEIGGQVNKISKFNTADIKFGLVEPSATGNYGLYVKCLEKDNCIQSTYSYVNATDYEKNQNNYIKKENNNLIILNLEGESKVNSQKLRNALEYFVDLAKENGITRTEDSSDPFSAKNYSRKTTKIISKENISNEEIKLEKESSLYLINISVNGITKKFILDSGASDVSINENFEQELINKGLIKKEDYISSALYKIADGSIVSNRRLIIRSLKIGNFTVENVKVGVSKNDAPLLLGKSLLDKFSTWSIDNQKSTLKLTK